MAHWISFNSVLLLTGERGGGIIGNKCMDLERSKRNPLRQVEENSPLEGRLFNGQRKSNNNRSSSREKINKSYISVSRRSLWLCAVTVLLHRCKMIRSECKVHLGKNPTTPMTEKVHLKSLWLL